MLIVGVVLYLETLFSSCFGVMDVLDGFLFSLQDHGGLGLQSLFVLLLLVCNIMPISLVDEVVAM